MATKTFAYRELKKRRTVQTTYLMIIVTATVERWPNIKRRSGGSIKETKITGVPSRDRNLTTQLLATVTSYSTTHALNL
jgi:hypothetical protein